MSNFWRAVDLWFYKLWLQVKYWPEELEKGFYAFFGLGHLLTTKIQWRVIQRERRLDEILEQLASDPSPASQASLARCEVLRNGR
jgi:hypothetical protein